MSHIQSVSSDAFENDSDMDLDQNDDSEFQVKTSKKNEKSSKLKRALLLSSSSTSPKSSKKKQQIHFVTENRFAPISPAATASELALNQSAPTQPTSYNIETDDVQPIPAPPPIFVSNIDNFIKLRTDLIDLIGTNNCSFKSTSKNLKIETKDSNAYRKVIRHLKEKQIEHHTYQAREDRAFRIVVRNLHPSTPTSEVGIANTEIGYSVRNVSNVLHKTSRQPLPLFLVDLDPAEINKDIFHLKNLLHTKISVEESHKRRELIQYFFLTSIPKHIRHKIQNSCEISSDHTPVILEINGSTTCKPSRSTLAKGPVNWEKFSTILENNTNLKISLKTSSEIEIASQDFVNSIKAAISDSSYTPNPNKPPNSNQYDIPLNIKTLIIVKRRVRSRWQHTRLPSDKKSYNYLSNTIKTKIRIHKSELFKHKYESLCSNDGSLWRTTKNILKIKDQPFHLKKADGTLAFSDIDKANTFGKHLSEIFTPHHDITPEPSHLKQIINFLTSSLPMSLPTKHTSPNGIKNLIQKLKIKKSPGHNQITNKILQHLPKKSIVLLTHIFNSMLRMSYFPSIWKLSVIILIHKPNKPKNEPSSYRPISLLPVLGKLFEKVMLKRIRPILKFHKIIPNTQFGFRENHSTTHQIYRIVDKIASSFETKNFCPGVFLDVSQAFDRVWHTGLLFKLKMFLPTPLYLLTKSYLQDRSFLVRQGDSLSSQFKILAGVPQGSDLSPDLYNIYTADIPNCENTLIATYADDTAILSSHPDSTTAYQNLQIHLDNFSQWSTKWRIKSIQNQYRQVLSHSFYFKKSCSSYNLFSKQSNPNHNSNQILRSNFRQASNLGPTPQN
ncbi:hypothetical protein QTP88_005482 [Uroleucon formosanum]